MKFSYWYVVNLLTYFSGLVSLRALIRVAKKMELEKLKKIEFRILFTEKPGILNYFYM